MEFLKKLKQAIIKNGGASLTGNLKKATFQKGYLVAIEEFNKNIKTLDDLTIKDIKKFKKIAKKLGAVVGFYTRDDDGSIDIDISINISDIQEAIKTGRKENQEAIFDCKNKRCIKCK
jgi:hypothetical protein